MARKPVVIAVFLLLASGNVSAQPDGWRRTAEEDKAFDADWKACAAQSNKPVPKDGPEQLRGQGNMATPLGNTLGLVPYGNWEPKPGFTNDYPAAVACMKQRGWRRR